MANIIDAITSPLKAASDAAEKMLQIKGILDHGDEIRKLHDHVVTGLKAARIAQVEQTAMQNEIDGLKRKVADLEARDAKMERYELKRLPPGVFVMALKPDVQPPEPFHYACEKCYQDGKIYRLNSFGVVRGQERFHCNSCGSTIVTGDYVPPKTVDTRGTWRTR